MTDQTTADPFARTAATRRVGLAAAMIAAPTSIVIAETIHALIAVTGVDELDNTAAIAMATDHPDMQRWGGLTALLGALLFVPAALGVMRLVRTRAAWLGLIGGTLVAAGYICYFALIFQGAFTELAMAQVGGDTAQSASVLDAFMAEPAIAWVGPLFVLGNIVGTFILGLALVRSRSAGRLAGYGLMTWAVLHVLSFSPWFEVVGAAAQAAGMITCAVALARRPDAVVASPAPYELLRK